MYMIAEHNNNNSIVTTYLRMSSILLYPIALTGLQGTTDDFATITFILSWFQLPLPPFGEFIIFSNSYLNLSASLLTGNMVLVQNVP